MKTVLAIALSLAAVPAFAQSVDNTAISGSESNSQTYGSVNNNISTTNPDSLRTTSNASIGGFAGSFSPDNCTGTAGLAIGGTGWGVSAGAPKNDEGCERRRNIDKGGALAAQGASWPRMQEVAANIYMVNVALWCNSTKEIQDHCIARNLVTRP